MAKKTAPLLPATGERLRQFGSRLRLARLRRKLSAIQVAQRAGMTPLTLRRLERGGSGVTIGAFLSVMQVLGLDQDVDLLAQQDVTGRELQDSRLSATRKVAPTKQEISSESAKTRASEGAAERPAKRGASFSKEKQNWVNEGGFSSAESLAALISSPSESKKRP